jgi:AraC family carnitine catabolism transcriptional activator
MTADNTPLIPQGAAYFRPARADAPTRAFVFLICPSFTLLAFASAVEPLRIANQLSQRPLYDWRTATANGTPVTSSCGLTVQVDGPLGTPSRDTALVVCAGNQPDQATAPSVVSALQRHHRHGGHVGGLCTGPFALAKAGLLTNRRFTLHWENQPAFREMFPTLTPSETKFEIDDRILTSGGGAAATDLMIDIIARDQGEAFATMVLDMCLRRVAIGRDPGQRSSLSAVAQLRNPGLAAMVDLMKRHIEEPLSMEELSARVGYSRRNVERIFRKALGLPPARFYLDMRLDHARTLLSGTDLSLSEISAACGFATRSHFSKAFTARFGTAPSRLHARL